MTKPGNNHRNRILKLLSSEELRRLEKDFEPVALSFKEPVHEQGRPIKHLYFPVSGVISLVTDVNEGQPVETGTIGREGVVGIGAFLRMPNATGRAFCQIPGEAIRMRCEVMQAEVDRGGSLGLVLLRYTNAMMAMLAQGVACNRSHTLEQRMSRWLLMTRDRVDSDDFPLTQEFLAQMVGVRRPTVSLAGAILQRAGLIKYSRGRITVIDRAGLEEMSCECYAFVRDQFDKALDGRGRR
jgi:CRP-like cAMP-binding protein